MAGLTGVGTAATSVRFWAGSSTPESAPFRVTQNGMAYMSGGKIGYFEIMNNRLVWEGRDYFGDTSRTIKLGYGSNNGGLVDVAFGASITRPVRGESGWPRTRIGSYLWFQQIHSILSNR